MIYIYIFALKGVDICNFADDTTSYVCDSNLKTELETLEHNSEPAIAWFEMNCMKLNTDKCHLLISGNKNEQMWAKLDRDIVWESNDVKLLGITLHNNLKFDKHVPNTCSKANRKLSALTRVPKFLPLRKDVFSLKLLLSRNLNIVHLYGCFMEGKLMIR